LMRKLETYQSWNVSDTRIVEVWLANPGTEVWGICSTVNDGFPFLQWQFDDAPAQSCGLAVDPPEWTIIRQGLPMPSTNSCDDVADSRFAYGTGLRGEWGRSWEPWVDSGDPAVAGGWACVRVIVNKGGVMWMIENSLL
jgi:hypothetical protein